MILRSSWAGERPLPSKIYAYYHGLDKMQICNTKGFGVGRSSHFRAAMRADDNRKQRGLGPGFVRGVQIRGPGD